MIVISLFNDDGFLVSILKYKRKWLFLDLFYFKFVMGFKFCRRLIVIFRFIVWCIY